MNDLLGKNPLSQFFSITGIIAWFLIGASGHFGDIGLPLLLLIAAWLVLLNLAQVIWKPLSRWMNKVEKETERETKGVPAK